MTWIRTSPHALVAVLALAGILGHLSLRYLTGSGAPAANVPLLAVLLVGGAPLVLRLVWRGLPRRLGSVALPPPAVRPTAPLPLQPRVHEALDEPPLVGREGQQ